MVWAIVQRVIDGYDNNTLYVLADGFSTWIKAQQYLDKKMTNLCANDSMVCCDEYRLCNVDTNVIESRNNIIRIEPVGKMFVTWLNKNNSVDVKAIF